MANATVVPICVVCIGFDYTAGCFIARDHIRNLTVAGETREEALCQLSFAQHDYDIEHEIKPLPCRN